MQLMISLLQGIGLFLLGGAAGIATSAGLMAILITLGVIPRIMGRMQLAENVFLIETMLTIGGVAGCVLSFGMGNWTLGLGHKGIAGILGQLLLGVYGIGAGVFVGCQAIALAEILNIFPIMFRRMKLQIGLPVILLVMAAGKIVGAWISFFSF